MRTPDLPALAQRVGPTYWPLWMRREELGRSIIATENLTALGPTRCRIRQVKSASTAVVAEGASLV